MPISRGCREAHLDNSKILKPGTGKNLEASMGTELQGEVELRGNGPKS